MVQRGDGPRLAFEPAALLSGSGLIVQGFDRNRPVEAGVACAVDFAPAAGADERSDLVRTEAGPSWQRHAVT
jgi:hypothetical protein